MGQEFYKILDITGRNKGLLGWKIHIFGRKSCRTLESWGTYNLLLFDLDELSSDVFLASSDEVWSMKFEPSNLFYQNHFLYLNIPLFKD